jgi:ADP-ribose 1''-phosphate phosphatase
MDKETPSDARGHPARTLHDFGFTNTSLNHDPKSQTSEDDMVSTRRKNYGAVGTALNAKRGSSPKKSLAGKGKGIAKPAAIQDPKARISKAPIKATTPQRSLSKSPVRSPAKSASLPGKSAGPRSHSPGKAGSMSGSAVVARSVSLGKQVKHFTVDERYNTDFFDKVPENAVLIHACNCKGSWGGGIALAFKKFFPNAYQVYQRHCSKYKPEQLVGKALLIAPCDPKGKFGRRWIGCLFTSKGYGMRVDSVDQILRQTRSAFRDLLNDISTRETRDTFSKLWICRINAGLFKVPWQNTLAILEDPKLYVDLNFCTDDTIVMCENGPQPPGDRRKILP